jgi:hypothetical protein
MSGTPSPCVEPPDAYRHDGFYLRFSMGAVDYLSFTGHGPSGHASISGSSDGGLLAIGNTNSAGITVAGAIVVETTRRAFYGSPHDPRGYATASVLDLDLLIDWYPNARRGWHVGGMLGIGALSVTDAYIPDSTGLAFNAGLFGGYDWWIGPQWSLGLMVLTAGTTSASLTDKNKVDTGYSFNALSAQLGAVITFH